MRLLTLLELAAGLFGIVIIISLLFGLIAKHLARSGRRNERLLQVSRVGRANGTLPTGPSKKSHAVLRVCAAIGVTILRSGVLSVKTQAELRQTTASLRLSSINPMAVFVGAKCLLLVMGIISGWEAFRHTTPGHMLHLLLPVGLPIIGLLLPDFIVKRLRASYLTQVEAGMADALDLLVICAEAGLPIGAAIGRVSKEMEAVNRSVSNEFQITAEEMMIFTDIRDALVNFGKRTGLTSVKRICSALNQTILAGSSISQALRVLSAEMRADTLTRYEARAAQLPVMLTLPMILFILPVVFIIAAGPAIMQLSHAFSHH